MSRHKLSNKNMITAEAVCSICGHITMYMRGSNPVCPISREESLRRSYEKRRKGIVQHRVSDKNLETNMGTCSLCGPTELYINGTSSTCKNARKESNAKSYAQRGSKLHPIFGITNAEVDELKKDGGCFICGTKENIHLDHDHATGRLRGLLCMTHNTALGKFKDNIEHLQRAIIYLENGSKFLHL